MIQSILLAIDASEHAKIATSYANFLAYKFDATLDAVYYCPHAADDGCNCRKPRPGLVQQAREDFGLRLDQCYLVGDVGAWDMVLAKTVGCRAVLVRTGWGEGSLGPYRHLWRDIEPDYVATDVLDAARWIATEVSRGEV